ncbi:MAG: molybdate metabolism regulator, partial [Rhodobacterales bacterium]
EPLADEVLWPLVAENLWLIDRALGVVNEADYPENPEGALDALATLPKLPARTTAPLLALALSGPKALRKRARAMLERETGFEPQLIALIDDSRQEVRAGAARWLGGLGRAAGAEPLQKRLKKEKSQVVRAALLAALEALGQDISAHVGPAAFAAEARKGLARASFKDLGWLDFEHLPELHYRDGTRLPVDVLKWWCALAVKLKAPGETEPFELCLGQLAPEDAETLSTLLFDAWLAHDTAPPSEADVEAYAQARLARYKQGEFWVFENAPDNWDDAAMLDLLRRHKRAETPNSGAPSKGILALASKVPPGHAVARVKSYLKQHGRRTSQTTALLELMAAKGDAMSLQVVIAAATRLRQKGVQARANELVQEIADRNGWTRDELADRTVPTGGLDDDGRMELPCSEGTRLYTARLDEKLGLTLFNPDGKVVKSLPS